MKKNILWVIGWLFATSLAVTSCEETDGAVDPYFKWEERNQTYIDSIAAVAAANPSQWKVIHTYKFPEPTGVLGKDVNDYVYCKVLENGDGDIAPLFSDSVVVNYRGQLIPLYDGTKVVFDQSYQGELNKEVAVPTTFAVGEVIAGWTTALQEMKEGDRWEIYIPQELGYGTSTYSSIPGYSTLIFDVDLVEVITNR